MVLAAGILAGSAGIGWGADFQKGIEAAEQGDYATAFEEWLPLAREGHSNAQFALAWLYLEGLAGREDEDAAIMWLTRAAEQGHEGAAEELDKIRERRQREQVEAEAQRKRLEELAAQQLRDLMARSEQNDPEAQYQLAKRYRDGAGVDEDAAKALKLADTARRQGHEKAGELFGELILQDLVYGSDVRAIDALQQAVEDNCDDNPKCVFDRVWSYVDRTGDDHLSLAEISRFQRNLVKYGAAKQEEEKLSTEEIAAINLASVIVLPITAASIPHSFDYDNDGVLSRDEVFGETEFAKLVGVGSKDLTANVDFQALGSKLQEALTLLPIGK